jgi:hypothetical protein
MIGVGLIVNAISQREGKMWRGTDRFWKTDDASKDCAGS